MASGLSIEKQRENQSCVSIISLIAVIYFHYNLPMRPIFILTSLLVLFSCSSAEQPVQTAELKPDYCTVSHFFFRAEMGWTIQNEACPVDKRAELNAAYDEGRILFHKKSRAQQLRKQIEEMENDNSFAADIGRVFGSTSKLERERELASVELEIDQLIQKAPDSAEYCAYEEEQKAKVRAFVPNFMLGMSSEIAQGLNGCSRTVR